MKEKKDNRNKIYIYYAAVLVVILIIATFSVAYAFFTMEDEAEGTSTTTISGKTDCIKVDLTPISDENSIKLTYNYPISDEFALGESSGVKNVKPVEVTVTNNCTILSQEEEDEEEEGIDYSLVLSTLSMFDDNNALSTYIPASKIRTKVDKKVGSGNLTSIYATNYLSKMPKLEQESSTYKLVMDKLTDEEESANTYTYTYITPYLVESGKIKKGETITYYTYLWVDYYEGDEGAYTDGGQHDSSYDGSTENKDFKSVLTLVVNNPEDED